MTTAHSILSHPALVDCRRIFLRDYTLPANIGVYDFEKQETQRIVINVDLYVPLKDTTPQHDKLKEVLDYDFIRESIRARIKQGHINLQETLCDEIARVLLAHPLCRAVRVATEKIDVYADAAGVGVEVFHIKK